MARLATPHTRDPERYVPHGRHGRLMLAAWQCAGEIRKNSVYEFKTHFCYRSFAAMTHFFFLVWALRIETLMINEKDRCPIGVCG